MSASIARFSRTMILRLSKRTFENKFALLVQFLHLFHDIFVLVVEVNPDRVWHIQIEQDSTRSMNRQRSKNGSNTSLLDCLLLLINTPRRLLELGEENVLQLCHDLLNSNPDLVEDSALLTINANGLIALASVGEQLPWTGFEKELALLVIA